MNNTDFYIRRIHSITGVAPIGFFMLEHLFSLSRAIAGPEAFNKTVAALANVPFLVPIEITVIALPILFHALYGLYVTYGSENNPLSYSYVRNWSFFLQRVTAVIALFFIAWHVWVLRIGKALYDTQITFSYLASLLADPMTFFFYAIGLIASVFHFTNGLWTFMITWGITGGPRIQNLAMIGCGVLFFLLNAVGLSALVAFVI